MRSELVRDAFGRAKWPARCRLARHALRREPHRSQLFYSYSTNAGVTWARNVPVSTSFNPFLGYPNQNKIGDYITMVSDNTEADVAYTATFNGEQDVYYVRVRATGFATAEYLDARTCRDE